MAKRDEIGFQLLINRTAFTIDWLQFNHIMDWCDLRMDENLEFSVGNVTLRFTKEGRSQVKANEGIAAIEHMGIPFTTSSTSFVDIDSLVLSNETINEIKKNEVIQKLNSIHNSIQKQNKMLQKFQLLISKLYQEGQINNETLGKLDDFLKKYYDESYLTDDY